MIKLLATADIHLGRRSSNAGADHASPRHAWNDFVSYAVNERYDLVLLTGDIVDQDNRYFEGSSILEAGLKTLDAKGIHVFVVSGNHDFEVLPSIMKRFRFKHVRLLGAGGKWEREILNIKGIKVSITGWSFPQRHYRHDPLETIMVDPDDSDIRIGMVHGDLYDAKSQYAPLSKNSLFNSGHHAWFLGHVHKPDTLVGAGQVKIFYPGSLQALSPKETGPHGALHIELDTAGVQENKQIPFSRTRYERIEFNLTDEHLDNADAVRQETDIRLQQLQDDLRNEHENIQSLVTELTVITHHGIQEAVAFKLSELKNDEGLDNNGLQLRVRSVSCIGQLPPADVEALVRQSSPAGMLARILRALETDTPIPQSQALEKAIREQIRSIPGTIFQPVLTARKESGREPENEVRDIALRQCREALNRLINQKNA